MFARLLFAALLVGTLAGLALTALQAVRQLPLIHLAETYEQGQGEHAHAAGGAQDGAWSPGEGWSRLAFTLLANMLAAIGYALLLLAAFTLRGAIDVRQGLAWGLGGFAAFVLAPTLGLPPELPGSAAGDLPLRQAWWLLAAAGAAGGLMLLCLSRPLTLKALGLALLILPQLAPPPHATEAGSVPAELAIRFVSASLLTNLAFWTMLGLLSALAFNRLVIRQPA